VSSNLPLFKYNTDNPQRQCRNVIYSILDPIPARRLTAHQVLASEWVSEAKVCRAGNEGF
jgi:protein-serine/threonine kinase